MFNLQDITTKEYLLLTEDNAKEYLELKSILNPVPKFSGETCEGLNSLTFGEVSQLKRLLASPSYKSLVEGLKIVFKVSEKRILNSKVVDFFYALNWLEVELQDLISRESKALAGDVDPDLEMAGVKQLSVFGELNTLISIGKKFGQKPTDIEEWNYGLVFSIMLYDKVHSDVEKKYNEIKARATKKIK